MDPQHVMPASLLFSSQSASFCDIRTKFLSCII